jgi:cytochrome P450
VTIIDFDPFTASALADPYPDFARFVERQPVFWSNELGSWVVSRYGDVKQVLRRYDLFSAANALAPITPLCPAAGRALADGGFRSIPTLTNVDPPAHTRTRRIAQTAFSPRRVAALEPFVRGLVRRFIDERLHDGRAEIVSALTWELPALVVFEILGVPAADVAVVKQGAANRLQFMFGRPSEAEQVDIATGMASFWRYCEALAEDRRRAPRADFTSDLVHTPDQNGVPLSQQEVATILFGLLVAGHETTTNLLGNALRRLLETPARWNALVTDPTAIAGAVEEVLRFDSSVVHWRRRTTATATLSGVALSAGTHVLVCIGAANRDPDVFDRPHEFDLHRINAHEHLSFGAGPHLCLGAPLARLEARVVLEELTAALPSLHLDNDQALQFAPIIAFRGPRALHVSWA